MEGDCDGGILWPIIGRAKEKKMKGIVRKKSRSCFDILVCYLVEQGRGACGDNGNGIYSKNNNVGPSTS